MANFTKCNCFNQTLVFLPLRGITCKRIACYMRGSACRWFIVKKTKKLKHFEVMLREGYSVKFFFQSIS